MTRYDDGCQWQIQESVHEGAGFSLAAQEDEELRPGLGLQAGIGQASDASENVTMNLCFSLESEKEGDPTEMRFSPFVLALPARIAGRARDRSIVPRHSLGTLPEVGRRYNRSEGSRWAKTP